MGVQSDLSSWLKAMGYFLVKPCSCCSLEVGSRMSAIVLHGGLVCLLHINDGEVIKDHPKSDPKGTNETNPPVLSLVFDVQKAAIDVDQRAVEVEEGGDSGTIIGGAHGEQGRWQERRWQAMDRTSFSWKA